MKIIAKLLLVMAMSMLAVQLASALPRYQFTPGLELVYSGSSDFNFGRGAFVNSDLTTFWVTGQNKHGSWHVVYLSKKTEGRTGDFASTNTRTTFGHLDLFPDGRAPAKPVKLAEQNEYPAFLPLPAD